MEKFEISKDEWIAIGSISAFSLLLIILLPKIMNSQWFTSLVPPLQYLIYNIGFILLTIIIFGVPISYTLKQDINLWTTIKSGFSSWLIFTFILDLWQPPFAFGPTGEYLINTPESLIGTSVDYMLGWVYMRLFPINGIIFTIPIIGRLSLLFILVYFITPVIAALVVALLLKPKIFAKLLNKS